MGRSMRPSTVLRGGGVVRVDWSRWLGHWLERAPSTAAAAAKAMPRLQADVDTSFTHALPGHAAAYRARGCVQFSRRYLANSLPERGRRRPRTGSPTTAAVGPERHSRPPSVVFRVVPRRPAGRRAAVDAGRRRKPRGRAARRPRRRVRRFYALGALGAPPRAAPAWPARGAR